MVDPLPALSHDELETLQAALDPLLDGFGASGSCLDDALAYLERLGVVSTGTENGAASSSALPVWIERWREAGGNRQTLRLMVATLLAAATPPEASHGSGAAGLAGDGLATS
ncbi:MAG: hypothetical protein VKK97_13365 [Synechococcaceae cyanobacterium]|nr:hypothetical protein [Synechococcaceae cyanobacterium]